MEITVESPAKLARRLVITVPADEVDGECEKRLQQYAKTASIKGFRPGKVPLALLKQKFGGGVRHEVLNEMIERSLRQALTQEKLNPVLTPTVEIKQLAPGKPLEFTAAFEVLPEIDHVAFEQVVIEKPEVAISDSDIDAAIERLRERYVKWNPVTREARDKDQLTIAFDGTVDGKPLPKGKADDFQVVLGSRSMIPGFEEGLIGLNVGAETTLNLQFPDNYHAADIAGKKVTFTVKVKKIAEPELPVLDEALLQKVGISSGQVADLRQEIEGHLSRELQRIVKFKVKEQIQRSLIAQNSIDLPLSLIERESHRLHDQEHHGEKHQHTPEEMQQWQHRAEEQLRLGLLYQHFIKEYTLAPTVEQVRRLAVEKVEVFEQPEIMLNWYLQDKRRKSELESEVLEDMIIEKLLAQAEVKVVSQSFAELTEQKR